MAWLIGQRFLFLFRPSESTASVLVCPSVQVKNEEKCFIQAETERADSCQMEISRILVIHSNVKNED